ncbi:hypothetical protein Clacol_002917 [Clathrus columnatus]|uniref:Uncharacterized protein n=1 Tax=Clathrus columnatus TaxID=1419009 RepID=A0AAV5A7T1_9AGAM|nr:hypothetical protein Clacol_002917 [Clathrus columnatus]
MVMDINEGHSKHLENLYSKIRPEFLEDQEDPLAFYHDLAKWILDHYSDHANSGLLEILEECLRRFQNDPRYTGAEYRYVTLWILFASHVERPAQVYEYMMARGIGKLYSPFFEGYSEALEQESRLDEADTIIALGVRSQAKPTKRLLKFQADTQVRRSLDQPLPRSTCHFKEEQLSERLRVIRRDPLRNLDDRPKSKSNPSSLASGHKRTNPYALLNAPPDPGRPLEKLHFDLTLLLEPDGTEYCFEEVRARHLGLLGKKWPAPPPPNNAELANVDFNDQGTKASKHSRRQSVTVTINTKQALDDVFEMYNSPGVQDQIPDVKPMNTPSTSNFRTPAAAGRKPVFKDENMGTASKPRAFQALSEQKRENITPALPRFQPVLSKTPVSNAFTPNLSRQALASKEVITPVPAFKVVRPPLQSTTPASAISELKPLIEEPEKQYNEDVFVDGGGDDVTTDDFTEEFTNVAPPPPPPRSFVPFADNPDIKYNDPDKQRRPIDQEPKILKFQVHRDENNGSTSATFATTLKGSTGPSLPSSSKVLPFQPSFRVHRRVDTEPRNHDDGPDYDVPHYAEDRRAAMSNRFGPFEVMTPITERTAELTTGMRHQDTPSDKSSISVHDKIFDASGAQDAAEKLAAELLEEEEQEQEHEYEDQYEQEASSFVDRDASVSEVHDSSLRYHDIDVGDVRSTQVLIAESGFKPPNPCCPAELNILSGLLATLPIDPIHHDLSQKTADNLKNLQKFADKVRSGGNTTGIGRSSNSLSSFLELDGDQFEIFDKLGEGGFGAVFLAKWIQVIEYRDDNEDEEEDPNPHVAIKVVRPADLWEAYALQRIISTIHVNLRRSIIHPHRLYTFKDESFLVLELCKQGTLLEIVNRANKIGLSQPGGGMEELLVMFFTVELMRIVEGLHNAGFIHGDLKIDNCLIRLEDIPDDVTWLSEYDRTGDNGWSYKGLKLIDFGRTVDTRLYPPGQTYIANWKPDQRDCIEMQEGRPWTYEADYAGLASIIYCMLFGKYIETTTYTSSSGLEKLKPSQPMKRYWQSDLWTRAFEMLLNSNQVREAHSLPIVDELSKLREEMEDWIEENSNRAGKNLKGMLKKIERESL